MVWGIRIDYLAGKIYVTDILVFLVLAVWGWERRTRFVKVMRSWRQIRLGKGWVWKGLLVLVLGVNFLTTLRWEVTGWVMMRWLVVAGLAWYVARNRVQRFLGWGLVGGLVLNLILAIG